MDRLETQELAYFLAVAEELHFGRAAARLRIAQPALSKAIRQLERRLGVRLLERNSRHVHLTPAGTVLLDDGRPALDAVLAAARHARQVGAPDTRLRLVMKPGGDGGLLPDILAVYEQEPDVPAVQVVFGDPTDRADLLRDGRADVALLHTPHENVRGLDTEPLLVEPRVAVLPEWHRLARRPSLRWADLHDATLPRWHGRATDGATGPEVADLTELKQLIVLGHTIGVLARSTVGQVGPELVRIPVRDAAPAPWSSPGRRTTVPATSPPWSEPRPPWPGFVTVEPVRILVVGPYRDVLEVGVPGDVGQFRPVTRAWLDASTVGVAATDHNASSPARSCRTHHQRTVRGLGRIPWPGDPDQPESSEFDGEVDIERLCCVR